MSFSIRFARESDAEQIRDIYTPIVEHTALSFEDQAPTLEEMRVRIQKVTGFYPWLVAADAKGLVLGYVYASRHRERAAYRWAVEVSAYIRESHRGLGLGKKLYAELLVCLRRQNFYRAYAGITLPNDPSIALHESLGFTRLGVYQNVGFKLGRWRDVGWWELALQEPQGPPADPRAITEI